MNKLPVQLLFLPFSFFLVMVSLTLLDLTSEQLVQPGMDKACIPSHSMLRQDLNKKSKARELKFLKI